MTDSNLTSVMIRSNLAWGASWGLFAGSVVALIVAGVLLLKPEVPAGVSPVVIVLAYPLAGVVAGVFVGMLRPLIVSRKASCLVGAVAGVPGLAALMPMALGPPWRWTVGESVGVLLVGAILGGTAGYQWWPLWSEDKSSALTPRRAGPLSKRKGRKRR